MNSDDMNLATSMLLDRSIFIVELLKANKIGPDELTGLSLIHLGLEALKTSGMSYQELEDMLIKLACHSHVKVTNSGNNGGQNA